jgi:hypothetical protein
MQPEGIHQAVETANAEGGPVTKAKIRVTVV